MSSNTNRNAVLDEQTLELLGSALEPVEFPSERLRALRSRLMDEIRQDSPSAPAEPVTVRLEEGAWIRTAPKIEKKILRMDSEAGTEAYLLRMAPGATVPAHEHQHDEICLVLSGELSFTDIHLKAGDFHVSPKGSRHGTASSVTGALLYLETSLHANTVAL